MPYITQSARKALDTGDVTPDTAGELNYLVTKSLIETDCPIKLEKDISALFTSYLETCGESYQTYNDIFGVGYLAIAEYRRRTGKRGVSQTVAMGLALGDLAPKVAAYEDQKILTNGDVYPVGHRRGDDQH